MSMQINPVSESNSRKLPSLKKRPKKEEIPKTVLHKFKEEHCILPILSTRFNQSTWEENRKYATKIKYKSIYCAPLPISEKIPHESNCAVIEMNNDANQILGIGLIKNIPHRGRYCIYGDGNYNRYNYVGKRRIDRSEMSPEEIEFIEFLDILCFKGQGHLKRGQGLTIFPIRYLYSSLQNKKLDIVNIIREMFNSRLSTKK